MRNLTSILIAVIVAIGIAGAQSYPDTVDGHVAAATAAAGSEYGALVKRLCTAAVPPAPRNASAAAPRPAGPPARETWYAPPAKVFDNLYFLGQSEYSAWAVKTPGGIIIIDPIFDYSVEEEVVNGLKALGSDPNDIKYVLISHAHSDHVGGASYLQDRFNAKVIMSEADWQLLEGTKASWRKPRRELVATDGQKLTLGGTTLTLTITPGHTLGTISTLIPVLDNGKRHVAAYWGGTAFNWVTNRTAYITPERPDSFWFNHYIQSAQRFRTLARNAGADVILSNHSDFDGSDTKLPALAVIGAASAVTRTIAVTRVLGGAPVDELSPLDLSNQRQFAALYGIAEGSEYYQIIDRDMRYASMTFNSHPFPMLLHVAPGGLFLLMAPLQLSARLRRRYATIHRSLGYLLLLLAIPFALTGLYIAVRDPVSGPVGASAAVIAGVLFIHAGARAYLAIKAGDRGSHRIWMLRFLALAYSIAVIRALSMIVLALAPIGPRALLGPMFWVGWIVSALLAEWWIRNSRLRPALS